MLSYAQQNYIYPAKSNFKIFNNFSNDMLSLFERDRMQVIFSDSFKRLANKTQVFDNMEGSDGHKYRTRLTHSLEVAQLSSAIAKMLGLNYVLAEILGLSHDIAHACFGHLGQEALNECMQKFGLSFEHNSQAIRLFTVIEPLAISPIVLDGLRKRKEHGLLTPHNYGESQVMNKADAITYIAGDIQDALSLNKITIDQLKETQLYSLIKDQYEQFVNKDNLNGYAILHQMILEFLSSDLICHSSALIYKHKINTAYDFMQTSNEYGGGMIAHSEVVFMAIKDIKEFMFDYVYHSPEMQKERAQQKHIVKVLFNELLKFENHHLIGENYMLRHKNGESLERTVCDYIAGCDDKFVVKLYEMI